MSYSRCVHRLNFSATLSSSQILTCLTHIQAFKANSRNAALLEEYLRIRGDEFIKASSRHENPQEDPAVTKPGAGRATGEVIPATEGASGSGQGKGLFGVRQGKPVADAQRKT